MPRTNYRFRVAPIINEIDSEEDIQGEWSDIQDISTKDNLKFDLNDSSIEVEIQSSRKR